MELRELKKEIENLSSVSVLSQGFQEQWLKPLRLQKQPKPVISRIPQPLQKKMVQDLSHLQQQLVEIKHSQIITEKMQHYAHALIELKLASLSKDTNKAQLYRRKLKGDPFLNMKTLHQEIAQYQEKIKQVEAEYSRINEIVEKHLSLEDSLGLSALPHKSTLKMLTGLGEKYQQLAAQLQQHTTILTGEAA